MSEGSGGASNAPQSLSSSSPGSLAAEVDDSPLQKTMDKNKESLKVKLMMRRPINQLVAQGIMPSLKTPPAFHEQRQKLERAKMGDLLKAKIQQRPDREELVRQHILEADVTHVDPSLAERQRMLKKARLADSLNDQLSHRPGPLELIKKNILHTEEPIERAVKEGVIPFKATSEGQLRKPQHPDHYITFEEDSQSSEGGGSPSNTPASFVSNSHSTLDNIANSTTQSKGKESRPRDVLETAAASAGIVNVAVTIPTNAVVVTSPILQQIPNDKSQTLQTFAELCSSVVSPLSLGSSTSSLSPLSSIASPPTPLTPRPAPMSSPAPGKADKNRKKSKTKTQPKTRTIKFHEYKGPPNAQKNTQVSASSTETSYELLLQQQQLFLQWQLEWQHKYPQILLPAAQKPTAENISNLQSTISTINASNNTGTTFLVTQSSRASTPVVRPATPHSKPPSSPPSSATDSQASTQTTQISSSGANSSTNAVTLKVLTKLEDMKVSDLKMELKKRNLPVSGPKPQLIERLKPFAQTGNGEGSQQQMETNGSTAPAGSRTVSVSSADNPGSVVSEMDVTGSPPNQNEEDEAHYSPSAKTGSPTPSSPAPSAMDTSEPTPPTSPSNGDIIIQQQQRKIEELQRELEKSQQQLQQIRQGKESSSHGSKISGNPTAISSTIPVKALLQNGIIHIDPKSQQKLILQQQLQNKIQQQQLQVQFQQLQQQNGQQFNETVNAKANLAAFITQQQAQQQLNNLLQTANNSNNNKNNNNNNNSSNNNNNNNSINNNNNNNSNKNNSSSINNNTNSNNKNSNSNTSNINSSNNINNNNNNIKNKLSGRRSIVLGQQQAAIVLNHLNLVKQKNGILGHQRTSSLPAFLGALVQNTIATVDDKQDHSAPKQNNNPQTPTARRAGSEEHTFILTAKPPPPEYDEATKALKQDADASAKPAKNVKSQIVDDVLEILIKNGELPPSAAPAPPPPPPPPLPQPGFSVTLPTSITLSQAQPPPQFNLPNTTFSTTSPFTLTTQSVNPPTYTLTQAYVAPSSEGAAIPGNQRTNSSITFSVGNPTFINSHTNNSKTNFSSGLNYLENAEFMSTESSDFDINNSNDQNFHSNSLDYILSSNDNLLSSELSSSDNMLPSEYGNGDINLKELGLDLETLDSMDFSQLDCKMDANDTEMDSTPMEGESTAAATTTTTTPPTTATTGITTTTTNKTDQLINNNPDLVKPELMEPMEMDDNWLDSLMPLSEPQSGSHFGNSLTSSANGYEFLHCNDGSYESLLGNSQDPFELFDIHDSDFKMPSSSLSWDKVDFAT